jgi:hypothetical protein
MSIDTRYLIQYEGPFGEEEWKEQLDSLNALPNSFGFREFGYETIIGEVKNSADEEVKEIALRSSPTHILKRTDQSGFWVEIYKYKNK